MFQSLMILGYIQLLTKIRTGKKEVSLIIQAQSACSPLAALTSAFQPRRRMIAPAADGCKTLVGRLGRSRVRSVLSAEELPGARIPIAGAGFGITSSNGPIAVEPDGSTTASGPKLWTHHFPFCRGSRSAPPITAPQQRAADDCQECAEGEPD